MNQGIEQAFQTLGISYDAFFYCLENWEEDEVFAEKLEEQLKTEAYKIVFSVNFCPIISKVCEVRKIKYIAWVYDSPMNIRNLDAMNNPYTFVYLFDKGMVEEYKSQGYRCEHMPLAVSPEIFGREIRKWENPHEISFIGKMYQTDYAKYLAFLPEYRRGYLNGLIAVQGKIYGAYLLGEALDDKFMEELNKEFAEASEGKLQIEKRELEFMLASEVTARERMTLLTLLAKHFKVDIYAEEQNPVRYATYHGYVDYDTKMPDIFANSKINMNISLKSIRTGIPLRVLDIMGCGGFVLSNYQEELAEYMNPGVDCEIYESLEDAYCKADFYLRKEDLRKQIAQKGLERVKSQFTFEERIKQMMKEK